MCGWGGFSQSSSFIFQIGPPGSQPSSAGRDKSPCSAGIPFLPSSREWNDFYGMWYLSVISPSHGRPDTKMAAPWLVLFISNQIIGPVEHEPATARVSKWQICQKEGSLIKPNGLWYVSVSFRFICDNCLLNVWFSYGSQSKELRCTAGMRLSVYGCLSVILKKAHGRKFD